MNEDRRPNEGQQTWQPNAPQQTPMGHAPAGPEAPGATAGLVLGILSIVLSGPIVGLILGLLGFTKSKEAKAACEQHPGYYRNEGAAQAGYICSIIGLCLGGLTTLCGCGYFIIFIIAMVGAAAGAGGGP